MPSELPQPRISSTTPTTDVRVGYLFGHPIAHSLSPLLHGTLFREHRLPWTQNLFESRDVETFLRMIRSPQCFGSAVTMPHKVAIIPRLDEVTPQAADVGAVNTIVIRQRNGKRHLVGTNTDVDGVVLAFERNVSRSVYEGRPALVIGGGGAARSAVYALRKRMHASQIYLVSRDASEVGDLVRHFEQRGLGKDLVHVQSVEQALRNCPGEIGAVVSCVPDYPPKSSEEKTARRIVETLLGKPNPGAVLEMCYHPSPRTAITRLSEENGWKVILGTEAMIWQGIEQSRLWTGKEPSLEAVDRVRRLVNVAIDNRHPTAKL